MSRVTKQSLIKAHLISKGSITSLEAIREYSATRLSHHIYVLRQQGMQIDTLPIEHIDKYGNKTIYGKYILKK